MDPNEQPRRAVSSSFPKFAYDEDDTDSEVELFPSHRRQSRTLQSQPRRTAGQPQAQLPTTGRPDTDNEREARSVQSSHRQRSNTLASQPPRQYERPQAPSRISPPYAANYEQGVVVFQGSNRRVNSIAAPRSQQPSEQPPTPYRSSQAVDADAKRTKKDPKNSDDWDLIERTTPVPHSTSNATSPPPSYAFPGKWDAALHDSSSALSQVGIASKSYASALSRSGLGRAGRSIGSALLSSTNKGALSLASWAAEKAGADATQLPGPVKGWLEGKSRLDEARWRARRAEQQRRVNRAASRAGGEGPLTFGDERGAFVLETYELDGTGEFVGSKPRTDDGWTTAPTSFSAPMKEVEKTGGGEEEEEGVEEGVGEDEEEKEEDGEGDGLPRVYELDD